MMSEVSIRFKPFRMDLIMWNNNLLNRFSIFVSNSFALCPGSHFLCIGIFLLVRLFCFSHWEYDKWIWYSNDIMPLSLSVFWFKPCYDTSMLCLLVHFIINVFVTKKTNSILFGQAFRINERLSGIHAFSIFLNHRAYGIIDNEITTFCSSFIMITISVAVVFCYCCCWRFCISVKAPIKISTNDRNMCEK